MWRICERSDHPSRLTYRYICLPCCCFQVVSTAVVTPDSEASGPVREAVTTTNIAVTGCPGEFSEATDDATSDASDADTSSAATDGVTVSLGRVSTAAVDRALWALRVVSVGAANGVVTKDRGEELTDGLKFRMTYTKRSQRVGVAVMCMMLSPSS